jgi:hypothetical protein
MKYAPLLRAIAGLVGNLCGLLLSLYVLAVVVALLAGDLTITIHLAAS